MKRDGSKRLTWIEVWTDGASDMLAFHLERAEADTAPGLRRVWFVLSRDELARLESGEPYRSFSGVTLNDGYHRMSVDGMTATFYDWELPTRGDSGVMTIPFLRLAMPRATWRYFGRIARTIWKHSRAAIDAGAGYDRPYRIEIEIPEATLTRLATRHAPGTGRVDMDLSPRCRDAMAQDPGLRERVERCECIARNSTFSSYQRASLRISNDSDGYYFQAFAPSGARRMNGGIVNHARNGGAADWSIHT